MEKLNLKPTHKPVQNYYEALRQFQTIDVSHEGAVRSAFQTLLEHCGRQFGWKLVPEWAIKKDTRSIRVDGALVDEYRLTHGFWEAKDRADNLPKDRAAFFLSSSAGRLFYLALTGTEPYISGPDFSSAFSLSMFAAFFSSATARSIFFIIR